MALTPNNAPDSLIKELFGDDEGVAKAAAAAMDRILAKAMPGLPALNAETLASGRVNEIDLRGRDIRFEFHGTFRGKQIWLCYDANTYDGDESELGEGESKEMALVDLMDKLDCDCADPFCTKHERPSTHAEREIEDQINEGLSDGN